jgi:hypothetical protein
VKTGGDRFFAIFATAWAASYLIAPPIHVASEFGSFVNTMVFALPMALFVSIGVWIIIRKQPVEKFKFLSPPIFWSIIVIGILGWGGASGKLMNAGVGADSAAVQALIGIQGALIAVGALGLFLTRPRKPEDDNAPNP